MEHDKLISLLRFRIRAVLKPLRNYGMSVYCDESENNLIKIFEAYHRIEQGEKVELPDIKKGGD